jgi:hypothetical protein
MPALRNRDGFALPMAILVIGFMTAGVVASFTRVGAEMQTLDNQRGQTAAFAFAEAGLAEFMVSGSIRPGMDTAAITYTYNGGSATVVARRIHQVGNSSLVLVRSQGMARSPVGRPQATRTVAQFGYQQPLQMQVRSAWTSLSGVTKQGNSGWFGGEDEAGTACGDGVTRAGMSVPTGGAVGPHINQVVSGDPPIEYMGSQQESQEAVDINWASMVNPGAPGISPSVIMCAPGTSGYSAAWTPCGSWPTNFSAFPTVIINGSMTLPTSGQGLLIVTGDLTLNGNQNWDGVILVGGRIIDNGQGEIAGSVVTGLNMKLGQNVGQSQVDISVANGQKRYQFNSCAVQNALAGASTGIRPIPNAWVDNWAAW